MRFPSTHLRKCILVLMIPCSVPCTRIQDLRSHRPIYDDRLPNVLSRPDVFHISSTAPPSLSFIFTLAFNTCICLLSPLCVPYTSGVADPFYRLHFNHSWVARVLADFCLPLSDPCPYILSSPTIAPLVLFLTI